MTREEFAKEFGLRLVEALEARDLNQSQAGRLLGCNPARLSDYCRGARLPSIDALVRIVDVCELDPRILFPQWSRKVRRVEVDPGVVGYAHDDEPLDPELSLGQLMRRLAAAFNDGKLTRDRRRTDERDDRTQAARQDLVGSES